MIESGDLHFGVVGIGRCAEVEQGSDLAFVRRPFLFRKLWVAAAKPRNLVAQVNGRVRLIPGGRKAVQLVVTPTVIVKAPPAA